MVKEGINGRRCAAVVLIWVVSAALLLLGGSFLVSRFAVSSRVLAWVESAVCFFAAAAAGRTAAGESRGLLPGLLVGLSLSLLLPGIGFLIDAERLSRDAVLSTVSFSLAGALCGAVLFPGGREKGTGTSRARRSFSKRGKRKILR